MPMPPLLLAWTTTAERSDAERLARGAVEAGLAACAQCDGPIQSTYRWEGKLEVAAEWRVLFKTDPSRGAELRAWVASHHPYRVPEWVEWSASTTPEYARWVGEART